MQLESSIDIHFPELDALSAPWRLPTVEVASLGVPSHLTLLWPWRSAPVSEQDIADLVRVVEGIGPLEITLDRVAVFPKGAVYLALQDEKPVRRLIDRLLSGFPECPPYKGEYPDPVPHVTLAKSSSAEQADRLLAELTEAFFSKLPLRFRISEIVVMQQQVDLRWNSRSRVQLVG